MRIMVFDVAAEKGGALTVLNDYYNEFKLDKENEYIIVVSLPELKETSNIKVLNFSWIKKSWLHRLFFDHVVAPGLIKKYNVDIVFSLQNIIIPHTKIYQSVLVHNALPFSEYKFSFIENKLLWIYQNIIGRKIKKSIRNANHVIVQANWIKQKLTEQSNITPAKVEVKQPKLDIKVREFFSESRESLSTFFYPASGVIFKNHKVIVDACLELKRKGITNYKIIFTLMNNENKHIKRLYEIIQQNNLPIIFTGPLDQEKVYNYYSKSVLLFPSYIETIGLPLLEARQHNTPILAANCEYSFDILNDYEYVQFFNPHDYIELSTKIRGFIT